MNTPALPCRYASANIPHLSTWLSDPVLGSDDVLPGKHALSFFSSCVAFCGKGLVPGYGGDKCMYIDFVCRSWAMSTES